MLFWAHRLLDRASFHDGERRTGRTGVVNRNLARLQHPETTPHCAEPMHHGDPARWPRALVANAAEWKRPGNRLESLDADPPGSLAELEVMAGSLHTFAATWTSWQTPPPPGMVPVIRSMITGRSLG